MALMPCQPSRRFARQRRALTLTELLIVLVILAVVATAAVQSLRPMADQARYETTRNTLQRIEEAILGPELMRQADGTPLISGFAADVGRLPALTAVEGFRLAELWDAEVWSAYPYQIRMGPDPVSDGDEDFSDIRLACGWRGPYLQPPNSTLGLRDGWGKPLFYDEDLNTLAIAADLTAEMPGVELLRVLSLVHVVGHVEVDGGEPGATYEFDVYMAAPDPTNEEDRLGVMDAGTTDGTFEFLVTPGLRALRAVVKKSDGAEVGSRTVYRHIPRSGLSDLLIDVQVTPPDGDGEGDGNGEESS